MCVLNFFIQAIRQSFIMKLQDGCDESATAQVWSDHFDQAKTHLDRPLPDHYNSTCEDIDLCEVHNCKKIYLETLFSSPSSQIKYPAETIIYYV